MGLGSILGKIGGTIVKNIPVIGSLAGNVIDYMSNRNTNTANAQMAQKQMDFQAQQSSTQYQRGVADMEKAGLNPALAYQQGGDTAQGGAQATMQPNTSNTGTKFAQALSSWNEMQNGMAQRDLLRSQATAQDAQATLAVHQAQALRPEALWGQSMTNDLSGKPNDNMQSFFRARLAKLAAEQYGGEHEPERFTAALNSLVGGTALSYAQAQAARNSARLDEQQFVNEGARRILPYLNTAKQVGNTLQSFVPRLNFSFDKSITSSSSYSPTEKAYHFEKRP